MKLKRRMASGRLGWQAGCSSRENGEWHGRALGKAGTGAAQEQVRDNALIMPGCHNEVSPRRLSKVADGISNCGQVVILTADDAHLQHDATLPTIWMLGALQHRIIQGHSTAGLIHEHLTLTFLTPAL